MNLLLFKWPLNARGWQYQSHGVLLQVEFKFLHNLLANVTTVDSPPRIPWALVSKPTSSSHDREIGATHLHARQVQVAAIPTPNTNS